MMADIQEGVWVNSMPPHEPIDWTKENEWRFLNGIMKFVTMTRDEFNRRYPDTLPPSS